MCMPGSFLENLYPVQTILHTPAFAIVKCMLKLKLPTYNEYSFGYKIELGVKYLETCNIDCKYLTENHFLQPLPSNEEKGAFATRKYVCVWCLIF